ncbi:fibronectin type III domain-containing protein [Microbacterium fluvii]|uniref:Fibronectin type III domain-containing protein n=1 Tax=Microbacterium fluvii TaxID=415215 RepID=A0ABW2HG77_9MICO|nr:fibronectin type III domain-containing protein [Microbacterium fluvii]MCU4673158.1 fibronectin type III domain-containing protein [Microbacterium fluvii]
MSLRSVVSAAIAGAMVAAVLVAAPAAAAGPSSPEGLTADASVDGTVKFQWEPSVGATAYRLEWSADPSFPSGAVTTIDTYARDYVTRWQPGAAADADLYWRVTAFGTGVTTSTLGEPSGVGLVQTGLDSAPEPMGPGSDGVAAQIEYPDPTVFSWEPVVGAISYQLEYTSDTLGGGASTTTTVAGTQFAPVNPLARVDSGGNVLTWKWRVRAQFYNGTTSTSTAVYGAWSSAREFQIVWDDAPTNLLPADGVTAVQTDLSFSWDAVPGAAKYRVTFGESVDGTGDNRTILNPRTVDVYTTTYIPTVQISDATRFWQVTPLDYANNLGAPSAVHQYKKKWTTQDAASLPSDPGNTAPVSITGSLSATAPESVYLTDLELAWEALPRATYYQVEAYDDSSNTYTCTTASTSATIMGKYVNGTNNSDADQVLKSVSDCLWASTVAKQIQAGRTYHWRVRGVDLTGSSTASYTAGLPSGALVSNWSDTRHLTVVADDRAVPETDAVDLDLDAFSADNPATVIGQPAPLLTWSASGYLDGSTRKQAPAYQVTFYKNPQRTSVIGSVITPSTTLRLDGVFLDNTTAEPYYAAVRPVAFTTPPWSGTMLLLGGVDNESTESFAWNKESHSLTGLDSMQLSDGSVRLSWNPQSVTGLQDGGSRGYQVRVYNGGTLQGIAKKVEFPFFMAQKPASSTDTSFPSTATDLPLAPGSGYSFDVAPLDANGNPGPVTKSATFSVGIATPEVTEDASVAGGSVAFTWSSVPGALKYAVQYRRVGAASWGTAVVVSQTAAAVTGLDQGSYEWQVRTYDAASNLSAWSASQTFVVGAGQSSLTLAAEEVLPLSERVLSWTSEVAGATRFQVQIADDAAFTTSVKSYETVATSLAIPDALVAGKTYYWRVKALSEPVGTSTALRVLAVSATDTFTVLTVPAKVSGLALSKAGTGLSASWTLLTGANIGADSLVSYVVAYREKSSDDDWTNAIETETAATAKTLQVDGLVSGVVYQFRVAAKNTEGTGPWSDVKELATATAPTAAPTITVTPKLGELSVKIGSISSSGNGGSAITGYLVQYRTDGGEWTASEIKVASTYAITGLKNTTDYQVSIAAINAVGVGPAAEATARTLGYSSAPQSVKATRGDKKATVSWKAPATPNGTVTGYVVQKRLGTSGEWTTAATTSASTLTASVTGLTNGKTYQVRVAAKTSVGTGTYSSSINVVPAGKPPAPTKVKATSSSKGTVTVSWPKVSSNGSAITGYVVKYSTNGSKWYTLKSVSASTLKVTSTKGSHGKKIYFKVYAKNAVGTSAGSSTISVVRK